MVLRGALGGVLLLKVGLTGGIACGKSTVARMLVEKGALLINADELAREVVEPGQPALQEIVEWLGEGVLKKDQTLDREAVAEVIFADAPARRKLNAIIHPRVAVLFRKRSAELAEKYPEIIQVWEIPLLIEAGMQDMVDAVVVVVSSREHQLERMRVRDGLSREEALKRIRSQMPLEEKAAVADYVIRNDGAEEELKHKVDQLWEQLNESARQPDGG